MADLVFGDPWRMENIDWVKGESVIIARTSLGDNLMKDMQVNGVLQLVKRKNEEIIIGQQIPERKEQVTLWKEAIKVLPVQLDSYLTTSPSSSVADVDKNLLKSAEDKLKSFVMMEEKLSKLDAVHAIMTDLDRYEKRINSPVHRIITGIKRRIKNIIKR